ncbi:hypothetical protein GWK47_043326 [Chionoecetes opilio]|uniref:Uncharacterized protein n=1 Tax=Chionoecetes opilio TaxID=41210 RepID=A0A8J4Y7W3_CHIOP|nr:hypothetical protein GWK47_043326 [Chionoecetes opilio]
MISWAAYHASQQAARPPEDMNVALTSLLPLFHDEAKSVAMIRHSMDIVKTAVDVLNPGQIPVLTCDQPLYILAKQIQWSWPTSYGEDRFVVMFGGLHIEMASLKVLGDLLEGSGWTGALVQAGVATSGTADSFLKASHVTRTRRAHQVTASSLYVLQQSAYSEHIQTLEDASEVVPFEDWCDASSDACPQFQFWYFILQLELAVMVYVRAIREADFLLYIEPLSKIVPWFFALDHTHYSRWVPIHLRDMVSLKQLHPDVYAEFLKGNFVVKKSKRAFSAVAIDQAHEQNNASVKGEGGAVGLTENPAALRRWMVSGPEMARLIQEFEGSAEKRQDTDVRHHEQKRHAQMAFAQDVRSLSRAMEEMGNPFAEYSSDLLVLNSRDVVDTVVADTVRQMEKLGLEQYETYVEERLVNQTVPITDPIKRNNLHLFSLPPVREKSRKQLQMSSLKNDCSLFSRLYIASQIRMMGGLRTGTKSDLMPCLENLVPVKEDLSTPRVQVSILDGAAIINMLRPGAAKTFQGYATDVFVPYVTSQLQHVDRLDIVWDLYMADSLKADSRSKRGNGVRRRVEPSSAVPGNWQEFLRINDNKTELFSFLASNVADIDTNKHLITTQGTGVLCSNRQDVSALAPCTHEEADTRILLHLQDAVQQGYSKVSIRTVDTDVVVLAIASANRLNISELWIAFGAGKSFRFIAAHEIAKALGPDRCVALPMFHAFTGCDTVSCFGVRGKKTAMGTPGPPMERRHTSILRLGLPC